MISWWFFLRFLFHWFFHKSFAMWLFFLLCLPLLLLDILFFWLLMIVFYEINKIISLYIALKWFCRQSFVCVCLFFRQLLPILDDWINFNELFPGGIYKSIIIRVDLSRLLLIPYDQFLLWLLIYLFMLFKHATDF